MTKPKNPLTTEQVEDFLKGLREQGDNDKEIGDNEGKLGVASLTPTVTGPDPVALARDVCKRIQRDPRYKWADIEPIRNQMMLAAKAKGMSKSEAKIWTYTELDRLYPPIEGVSDTAIQGGTHTTIRGGNDDTVAGLSDIPESWGTLPDNAAQATELSWCQAQRLRVCSTKPDGTVRVDLAKATIAAPSMATLSWLETSIRSYAKYVDVVGRVLQGQQEDSDMVRRERLRIEDIRQLLDEMHRD